MGNYNFLIHSKIWRCEIFQFVINKNIYKFKNVFGIFQDYFLGITLLEYYSGIFNKKYLQIQKYYWNISKIFLRNNRRILFMNIHRIFLEYFWNI